MLEAISFFSGENRAQVEGTGAGCKPGAKRKKGSTGKITLLVFISVSVKVRI